MRNDMIYARNAMFTALALAIAMTTPSTVGAQDPGTRRPIELGIDAAVSYLSEDNFNRTIFQLPTSSVRVGVFLTDAVSLEPSLTLRHSRVTFDNPVTGDEETISGTSYNLAVGLLFHLHADRTRSQAYLRPLAGIQGFSGEGESGNQVALGGAFGVKLPVADRLGTRIEAGFIRRLENEPEFPASNEVFLSFGLSFFTR
jgi:hypothetical protein